MFSKRGVMFSAERRLKVRESIVQPSVLAERSLRVPRVTSSLARPAADGLPFAAFDGRQQLPVVGIRLHLLLHQGTPSVAFPFGIPARSPLGETSAGGMNHDQFKKCVGQTLRLEPAAIGPDGRPTDDDWEVVGADDARKTATLRNRTRGGEVIVGFDHVKNYDSDAARGDKFGFLNMLWQLRIGRDGAITARPIPARPAAAPRPEFHPLIVNDGDAERHLTWSDRDGAVALLPEGEARQLFGTFIGVCDALRTETNRESATKSCGNWRMTICLSTSCSEAWPAKRRRQSWS
jgi:hypothetical protein